MENGLVFVSQQLLEEQPLSTTGHSKNRQQRQQVPRFI
jgi:hypothetical protein